MCNENAVGRFVASNKPSAGCGHFIGEVIKQDRQFLGIQVQWVQMPENDGRASKFFYTTDKYVTLFDSPGEAMNWLKSKGVKIDLPVNV